MFWTQNIDQKSERAQTRRVHAPLTGHKSKALKRVAFLITGKSDVTKSIVKLMLLKIFAFR